MFSLSNNATKKAVAYYRHSAEDKQENSVPIQREHALTFAYKYSIEIIHEEADEGKSGLSSQRKGFESLFSNWILNPDAPKFDYVLVYDVSRWGRFQDQDEAAYFEFRCKQHGKKVIYVSRGFPKEEQQLFSHLQTSIERYMAAEYSRQLSDKVFYGCKKVSEQGYSAGGTACYGMARLLLDVNKKPIRILNKGEHKQIANERVTFVPLNDGSTEAVKEMFNLLTQKWYRPNEIADVLNSKNIPTANGKKWDREKVVKVLTNETYIGSRIYNKTWRRLKQKMKQNPRNEWVVSPDAFPAVVEKNVFINAQEHLYWLMPSKWKRGVYAIRGVAKSIQNEVKDLLQKKGTEEDDVYYKIKQLPFIYCVSYYKDSTPHWCFSIPPELRKNEHVLAITLDLDKKEPLDRFFLIPTTEFNESNTLIFSERDKSYQDYSVARDKIEEKIMSLV